jgi:hypothetical protein
VKVHKHFFQMMKHFIPIRICDFQHNNQSTIDLRKM